MTFFWYCPDTKLGHHVNITENHSTSTSVVGWTEAFLVANLITMQPRCTARISTAGLSFAMSASSINVGLHHHVNKLVYLHDLACIVMYCHGCFGLFIYVYGPNIITIAFLAQPASRLLRTIRPTGLVTWWHKRRLFSCFLINKNPSKHHQLCWLQESYYNNNHLLFTWKTTQNSVVFPDFSRLRSPPDPTISPTWKRRTRCRKWMPESTFETIKNQWVGISLRMWNQYIW